MYEDVLVLRLDHVVALRPQAGHVTVYVDHVLVFHFVQHRIYDDERARPANTSARENKCF